MKQRSKIGILFFAVLAVSPFSVYGQSCPATLTYAPANPVLGQAITATFAVGSTPAVTATSNLVYLLGISASEPGVPTLQNGSNFEINLANTPALASFTFTPYSAGQVTLSAGGQSNYSFGSTPICGQYINAAPVTITVAPATSPGVHDALSGQYAFFLQGSIPQATTGSQAVAEAGSFTADGQGNITAGMEDMNSGQGSSTQIALTGSYSISATGHGTLNLKSAAATQQFEFFVPPTQLSSGVTGASLFSIDGHKVFGSGTLTKQTFRSGPFGEAALALSGDLPCGPTCISGTPVYESGLVSFLYGTITGNLSASAGSAVIPDMAISGTWNGTDQPTGRFTYSLSQSQFPAMNFVGYMTDDTHFFTVSTDSHATTYLLSGTGEQ